MWRAVLSTTFPTTCTDTERYFHSYIVTNNYTTVLRIANNTLNALHNGAAAALLGQLSGGGAPQAELKGHGYFKMTLILRPYLTPRGEVLPP
jgi:hypothetical protein